MKKNSPLNILFTSAGRRDYIISYFKEALGQNGKIYAANSSRYSTALQFADQSLITPLIYSAEYIPFLLEFCQKEQIKAIISLFDIDLAVLAQHKEQFEAIGTKVLVSSNEIIEICNDKWKTFRFLSANNFETPQTFLTPDGAINALYQGIINFPLVIKPRWGMGSIALNYANNEKELTVLYDKTRNEIFNSYLKYESAICPEECVLIQEKLNGEEYGIDCICDLEGNYINSVIKRKIEMRSGETFCAEIVENMQIRNAAERLSRLTKHIANMDIDVILVKNVPYIIDMNARFGGGYPFSHIGGANLPKAIVQWLSCEKVEPETLQATPGIISQKRISIMKLDF